jgi:hypothetical protein
MTNFTVRRQQKDSLFFCDAKRRDWPITTDIALQRNVGFLGYCVCRRWLRHAGRHRAAHVVKRPRCETMQSCAPFSTTEICKYLANKTARDLNHHNH